MRIGSLCTGTGALDMAVGGDLQWVCDFDKGAAKILAHRYPDIPNLHDLTAIDWTEVEPVDVITSGYPCPPFSLAGKRKGTNDDRHIWPFIADALRILRPRFAVFENVAGHVSLGLADVLADLASLGFDAEWTTVRASDVGAPHRRERLFIVATDTGRGRRGEDHPRRRDMEQVGDAGIQAGWDEGASRVVGDSAATPDTDEPGRQGSESAQRHDLPAWGDYEPAIRRWQRVLGRPAPNPTTTGRTGKPVLNPPFVEWMMGLPDGWVTDVPGLSRVAQLKALGNGVVPQQAAHALQAIA